MPKSSPLNTNNLVGEVLLTYRTKTRTPRIQLPTEKEAASYIRSLYPPDTICHIERVFVILLNRKLEVLGYHLLSMGGVTGAVIDTTIVWQAAILANATGIIVAHNHPSGNCQFSGNDRNIYEQLKAQAAIMQISLLDCMIITEDDHYSFTANN